MGEHLYAGKDLLGLKGLTGGEINYILDAAADMKCKITDNKRRSDELRDAAVATLFYENSTRTKMSFIMAAEYLGAKVDDLGVATSSVNKGETLVDTGKNLDYMGIDILVIRHQSSGAPRLMARNVKAAVINGGDGANEHPTQALLDMFTIRERFGGFSGLKVAIIGDIAHSRVAKSNVFGLTALGASVTLAAPSTLIGGEAAHWADGVTITSDVKAAVRDADAVMGLRIQSERQKGAAFPDLREYNALFGITPEVLSFAKPHALIMHPGPINRGVEMSADTADHERSVILEQAGNGVAVRMALLRILYDNGNYSKNKIGRAR